MAAPELLLLGGEPSARCGARATDPRRSRCGGLREGRAAGVESFCLARVALRVTFVSMTRRVLHRRLASAATYVMLTLSTLSGCRTTLDPIRLGQSECARLEIAGTEYAVCEAPLDHADATRDCELRGGHLLSLESSTENDAVAGAVFEVIGGNVWLGGTRSDDLVWRWPDGTVFWRGERNGSPEADAFVLWQNGEPNNSSSTSDAPEACLALTAEGGDWNDRSCELTLPYVCELA